MVLHTLHKKKIVIVGDSMIKHVNEGVRVSRGNSVKIRCHSGATIDDIIDSTRLRRF